MHLLSIIIGVILLLFIWWNYSAGLRIIRFLKIRGIKARIPKSRFFIRGEIFAYLPLYKKVTLEYEGKVGPLVTEFYATLAISIGLFLVAVAIF